MFITSKILRSPHAFATRLGGVSDLSHTSELNLAFGRGDSDETVLKNLEIFAKNVGFDPKSIVSLPQIHSDKIFKVGREERGKGYYICEGIDSGDGYITDESGVTLGIKTADCVPILIEAEKGGKIVAVSALHAGWRGTAAGIAKKAVDMLKNDYGVKSEDIRAAIGPCIHECCYEVGEDLKTEVERALGSEIAEKFITPKADEIGKYFCDLAGINSHLLLSAGIPEQNIDTVDLCTCCHPELFFSHRYSKGLRGTMLSVIFVQD